jgi:hypothetical protein
MIVCLTCASGGSRADQANSLLGPPIPWAVAAFASAGPEVTAVPGPDESDSFTACVVAGATRPHVLARRPNFLPNVA